jgi:hypothetical protein
VCTSSLLDDIQEIGGAHMNRCFTLSHIIQVLKVVFTFMIIGMIYSGICKVFGKDSFIAELFVDNFIFKAYNIVGFILIILFACGIWVGRAKSKALFSIVSAILLLSTIISYIPNVIGFVETISSWFNG